MLQLIDFIKEGLRINKNTKVKNTDYNLDLDNCKKNPQLSKDEIDDIIDNCSKLPIEPNLIKQSKTGGIYLQYDKTYKVMSKSGHYSIYICKPERYEGCYKIIFYNGAYMPPEFPIGTNGYLNKDGSLKLPTIEATFDHILKKWDKYNYTKLVS